MRYTQEVYPRPNILHLPRIWVKCTGVWGKSTPNEKDDFHKALRNVKNAYVTPKKFTPDLQLFYTFPVFGLNVHVLGVKVPPNAMKRIIFIKLYPTSKRRMLLSENLPQTSRFFTRIYPTYP